MQNNHHKEHLYKILVIGDLGVGKTSIIKRYVHHNFSPNYRATIGVDFALKVLNWDQETVRLQLWDIAGRREANFYARQKMERRKRRRPDRPGRLDLSVKKMKTNRLSVHFRLDQCF